MRIENVNEKSLRAADDSELYVLRLRFIQLWNTNFKGNSVEAVGSLSREDLIEKYKTLITVMEERSLERRTLSAIDRYIFETSIYKFSVPELREIVVCPDYCSIAGSYVRNPLEARDVDIVLRHAEERRDQTLELKLGRILQDIFKKDVEFIYHEAGPHATYIPLYDLVLRPKDKTEKRVVKEDYRKIESLRLKLIGTGALNSPRKDECLLIEYGDHRILIDAGPDIKADDLPSQLDAILVCDPESWYSKDARRLAKEFELDEEEFPKVGSFEAGDLEISPFVVKHTKHKTYGYKIECRDRKIIYAPEFFQFPEKEVQDADLAILEGSTWSKPIIFTGKVGGHAAVLETWEKAKKAGVKRIIFTHIGKPVEENLEEAEKLGIEIGKDGQTLEPMAKAALNPGRAFTPLKSRGGYGKYEFGDINLLWTAWAQGYIPEPGVAVETKIDGFRVQVHKWDDSEKIFSEDAKRDLSSKLPDLVKEIKSIKGSVILDGELTIYVDGKKVDRKDMPTYLMTENPPPFEAKIDVFECLYRDGKTLVSNIWTDRQKFLDRVFAGIDELLLRRIKPTIVKSKEAFFAAVRKHSGEAHSEGAMCKVINSTYSLDGQTSEWAKFKNLKELRVKIVGKEEKEGGGFIYTCEIKGGIPIGKTYSTKIEAKEGDILEVSVAEVKYDEEKDIFTWDNPIVRSKKPAATALTTKEQAIALSKLKRTKFAKNLEEWGFTEDEPELLLEPFVCVAKDGKEFGNITFKAGDKGKGIAQIHIMGLEEEEVEKLKREQSKILVARAGLSKLESILKETIGEHGAHVDMRFRKGKENEWQGNEVFIGNISGISKLKGLIDGKRKLRAPWKQSREDEPKTQTIGGPLGWMEAGAKKIDFFNPGDPGATANKYGAMVRIDSFDWEMYLADEHAKKFRIKDLFFSGNWLFAYVPITEAGKKGERIWMISKLKESDYEESKEEAKKRGTLKELEGKVKRGVYLVEPHGELIAKGEKKAIVKSRKLAALEDWAILVSGDLAYGFIKCKAAQKIDLEMFKSLERIHRITKKERLSWWKGKRTFFYYLIDELVPYEEPRDVEVPQGIQNVIEEVKFQKAEERFIPIFKVSEDEQIVGGVVYEPMKQDTQGDYSTEEEIREACYYFMEHSLRFKVMHRGAFITDKIKILENYIAPSDMVINEEKIKKGSWILIIRVLDASIWKDIKEGKLNGFSMAGLARRRKTREKIS